MNEPDKILDPHTNMALGKFWALMTDKLRDADRRGKRGWEYCEIETLLRLLNEEVAELQEALLNKDPTRAARECADIANYAMFIAANVKGL